MVGMWAAGALIAAALLLGGALNSTSHATVFHPATNPITSPSDKPFAWSTTPAYAPAFSWYSDESNKDIGNQSPSHVESVLESSAWLGMQLNFVSGGDCDIATNCTKGANKSGTWTYSGTGANVFGIHFGNNFIALLFANALTSFTITNLPHGVSNIYALTSTPLPGALLLLGTGVAFMGVFNWLRSALGKSTVA